ncbi:hypothetical protein KFL_009660010 [Klebsormidium nitens]|uniref:Uncharacterized protein n=1 Tax=Klebsormidium nitens TaxID=105231 RepID=A0A1Y1INQ5_KLENI|nr:hypothetical protein KFL_009660010 [Klebsormidium nitens]|eukprot:GAQ92283.1 hypothetical protein KFL_009660010 [Klebsormidium nitens]
MQRPLKPLPAEMMKHVDTLVRELMLERMQELLTEEMKKDRQSPDKVEPTSSRAVTPVENGGPSQTP